MGLRIGYGVDVHRLAKDYSLYVGGLKIEAEKGAVGHSDADVLIHAICDALLGALALRDIGFHFPDNDPKYKGIDSKILLKQVYTKICDAGYKLVNIDSTVVLEIPKLNPHIPKMQETLAAVLNVKENQISIKATTHERVDSFGKSEAIKAYAVCLLEKNK